MVLRLPPVAFDLFGATLLGVAVWHQRPLLVAASGLTAILLYELVVSGFPAGPGFGGLAAAFGAEWVNLANLLLILLGFTLLSNHFERSRLPDAMPALLPDGWLGGAALLGMIFVLSSFLDNIAAALIGGIIARHVYRDRVSIGFLTAIVVAANAGGSGSVIGDTTTTIMWLHGVSPMKVSRAFIAAIVALAVVSVLASRHQHRHEPIRRHAPDDLIFDWPHLWAMAVILATAVLANVLTNLFDPTLQQRLPVIGLAVWTAIIATTPLRRPDFGAVRRNLANTLFLLCLVASAGLMPVNRLMHASWKMALGLGFVSAVFDNIPLTALALQQGGYDWGFLAYAVGVGGSILWFGSSAGVAITSLYPEGRSVVSWVRHGWYVPIAYLCGFAIMLSAVGWTP